MYNEKFQQFIDMCDGNVYKAVNLVAKLARQKAEATNNLVLHSEAISWVLTSETPQILNEVSNPKDCASYSTAYISDVLSYIDDIQVCDAVRTSLKHSKKEHHLIYLYRDVSDEHRRARVRVLTRMIWYNLYPHSKY